VQNEVAKAADGNYLFSKEVYVIVTHQSKTLAGGGGKRRFVQMRGVADPVVSAKVHDIELDQSVPGKPGRLFAPTRRASSRGTRSRSANGSGASPAS
jgi:hypothetical protein